MSTPPAGGVGTPACLGFAFSTGDGAVYLIGRIVVVVATLLVFRRLCPRLRAEIGE